MAKTKKKQKNAVGGVVKGVIGIALAAICAFGGAFAAGYAITGDPNPTKWRDSISKPDDTGTPNTDKPNGTPTDGMTVSAYSTDTLSVYAMPMVASETAMTDSTFFISATVEPADADYQDLEWEIDFLNPSSIWASGKTVTDFVDMEPTSDTHNATLTCLGAFGEPIVVTVRSVSDPDVTAACTCNYVKRVKSITLNLADPTFNSNFGYTYELEPTAYTVDSDFAFTSVKYETTSDFAAKVVSLLPKYNGSYFDPENDIMAISNQYMTADFTNQTLSFKDNRPNCLFAIYTGEDCLLSDNADLEPVKALLDTAFRQAVKQYTGTHLWLYFSYKITHDGVTYGSGSQTININFSYESVRVPVSNIRLSQNDILM